MSKTITIKLTMDRQIFKRYEKVAQKTGDDTAIAMALALTLMIGELEKATIKVVHD